MPNYEYIKRTYSVRPRVGGRVVHTVTGKAGRIVKEDASMAHYVKVIFDGARRKERAALPCHPLELEYIAGPTGLDLRRERNRLHLSIRQLGKRINRNNSHLAKIERGERTLTARMIKALQSAGAFLEYKDQRLAYVAPAQPANSVGANDVRAASG